MKTCTVTVQVFVGGYDCPPDETRVWKNVDIMNTSRTLAWATRQFNLRWQKRKKDVPVRVKWECRHDDDSFTFDGLLSGVNGVKRRLGIFEYY